MVYFPSIALKALLFASVYSNFSSGTLADRSNRRTIEMTSRHRHAADSIFRSNFRRSSLRGNRRSGVHTPKKSIPVGQEVLQDFHRETAPLIRAEVEKCATVEQTAFFVRGYPATVGDADSRLQALLQTLDFPTDPNTFIGEVKTSMTSAGRLQGIEDLCPEESENVQRESKYTLVNAYQPNGEEAGINPYHNYLHAVAVAESTKDILDKWTECQATPLPSVDYNSYIVAALLHDANHPGVNTLTLQNIGCNANAKAQDPTPVNGVLQSTPIDAEGKVTLEQYHLRIATSIITRLGMGLNMDIITNNILETDMALPASQMYPTAATPDMLNIALGLIHIADIDAATKKTDKFLETSFNVMLEFGLQVKLGAYTAAGAAASDAAGAQMTAKMLSTDLDQGNAMFMNGEGIGRITPAEIFDKDFESILGAQKFWSADMIAPYMDAWSQSQAATCSALSTLFRNMATQARNNAECIGTVHAQSAAALAGAARI